MGIKPLDPFVSRNESGVYSGFSIDLWNDIARRNEWQPKYTWFPDIKTVVEAARDNTVDAAISGISITADREEEVDFSYPMFDAGLQILTGDTPVGLDLSHQLRNLVSPSTGRYLAALLLMLLLAGAITSAVTRVGSEHRWHRRMSDGMFRAAAVGLAGDLGDPQKPLIKVVTFAWLIAGLVFVSLFTASVTTQLTVRSIRTGITGVSDLAGKHVVTVRGSTAENYLRHHDITPRTVDSINDAYPLLHRGDADAIVYDSPVLQHHVDVAHDRKETLAGPVFEPEDYGIAFPTGSALRKKVNAALLQMHADGTYDELRQHYFDGPS
ncbi:transporter substrate-binding domain-containing protein [Candidatus Frankia nodulisporulans]|uniref:transporter substrate-binding domain-containing protein n=1 Tax=Candidatus Frankia nodulisporulans TaxID=2060052 RepID=UPI0013D309B3|nr:transporter substrate-binding domain-containing protein [Candidatus Frankia nodulisporulans]